MDSGNILNKLFIKVAEVFIALLYLLKNFSFDFKKDDSILSKLNIESEYRPVNEEDTKFLKFREIFLKYFLNKEMIIILAIVCGVLAIVSAIEIAVMFLVMVAMIYIWTIYLPKIQKQRSYDDLNQELPYALRHMGVELKSGKGLHDTLLAVSNSNYGSLSLEFKRVLEEVRYGSPTETSLVEMSHRVNSPGLARMVHQIVGTLRVGGNLATSLEVIADDISFDMQVKLKEYAQKLNAFILIYTFLAILFPVIFLVMLMAASTVMGDIISGNVIILIYALFFPMVVVIMGVFIKRLEPKI